jgi:CO/xanthine dehydrogenase Mo-binding subunit
VSGAARLKEYFHGNIDTKGEGSMEKNGFIRKDVAAKLTGQAKYADDIQFPRMLHAVTVHCPYPRARILNIDSSEAERMPGVKGVYTAKDIPGLNQLPMDKPMLAAEIANSQGDGVAVVAAETKAQAEEAAKKVKVDYEELPTVLDPVKALDDPDVILYGDSNLACQHVVTKGDVEAGFKEADVVIERTYTTQAIQHSALEGDAVVVVPENGGITVYAPCKYPYYIKQRVSQSTGLSQNLVRIVEPAVGGSFGGKDNDIFVISTRAAMVAMKTGRPCKMAWSREDCMLEGMKRHPFHLKYKVGAKKDGKITAIKIDGVADAGAYKTRTLAVIWRAAVEAAGPYQIENVSTHIRAAFTNHVYCDAVRGFGSPQVDFASESLMDELALALGMDPLAIRRKNMMTEGCAGATGQTMKRVSIKECLDRLEKEFPLGEPQITPDGKYKARGIACLHRGESYGAASANADVAATDVTVQPDGSVNVYTSISEVGQGTHSAMAKICADILGIPYENVTICPVDTAYVPDSGATAGSRGTISGGNAVRLAALNVKQVIAAAAAEEMKVNTDDIIFEDGWVRHKSGEPKMKFSEVTHMCFIKGIRTDAMGQWVAPKTWWDFSKGQGETYYGFSYGAAGAEVEIDPVTGKIEATELFCLHDIGKIVNYPEACGQINGGVSMALGQTLMEEINAPGGYNKTVNFDDYLLPTTMDFHKVRALPLEEKPAENPLGVHGVGEASTALVAPAVANAIARATGIRMRDLPFSLEKVRKAIQEKEGRTND